MQYSLLKLLMSWGLDQEIAALITVGSILVFLGVLGFVLSYPTYFVFKRVFSAPLKKHMRKDITRALEHADLLKKCTRLIPSIVLLVGSPLLGLKDIHWTLQFEKFVAVVAFIFVLYGFLKIIFVGLDVINVWYMRNAGPRKQPIKGYLQVLKIILAGFFLIIVVSTVLDKSPWALITGFGALSAIILLVFKDTITGFVANIQVSAYDLVRVGDWITIPSYNVDGDVVDININTVKVQNFDKTIVSIPTSALVQTGVQNWRGMKEAGARRIKRSIFIDMHSVKFCDDELLKKIKNCRSLSENLKEREKDILEHNEKQKHTLNKRQFTNIGLFRFYTEAYLRSLPTIHQSYTLMVRQLAPSPAGLPIEIYAFANDAKWENYESIQADIFDHLLAVMDLFELRIFQVDSNMSPANLLSANLPTPPK